MSIDVCSIHPFSFCSSHLNLFVRFRLRRGLVLHFWNSTSRHKKRCTKKCRRDFVYSLVRHTLIKRDTHVTSERRKRDFQASIILFSLSNAAINNREGERALRVHKTGKRLAHQHQSVRVDSVGISRLLVRSVRPALAFFARDPTTAGTNTWRRCDPRLFVSSFFLLPV